MVPVASGGHLARRIIWLIPPDGLAHGNSTHPPSCRFLLLVHVYALDDFNSWAFSTTPRTYVLVMSNPSMYRGSCSSIIPSKTVGNEVSIRNEFTFDVNEDLSYVEVHDMVMDVGPPTSVREGIQGNIPVLTCMPMCCRLVSWLNRPGNRYLLVEPILEPILEPTVELTRAG